MQAPVDCCDVSLPLEEVETVSAKERFIRLQKEQLEKDSQRLMDFASDLAQQVSAVLVTLQSTVQLGVCKWALWNSLPDGVTSAYINIWIHFCSQLPTWHYRSSSIAYSPPCVDPEVILLLGFLLYWLNNWSTYRKFWVYIFLVHFNGQWQTFHSCSEDDVFLIPIALNIQTHVVPECLKTSNSW